MDISKLSDEGLQKLYNAYNKQNLSALPDAELQALYARSNQAPAASEQTAGQMAAEGIGPLRAGLIGAGKSTDALIQGAKQLYYRATGNQPELDALQQQQGEADANYAPLKQANPWMTGLGESLPSMAAMVASGGSASLPLAVAKGAASTGLTEAAKYGTDQQRLDRGIVGAAEGGAGTLGGYALGRIITPAGRSAAAAGNEATAAADRLGIQLTPGQTSGNVWLRRAEQMLAQRPGSGGVFADLAGANQEAINRGAASAMGEKANAITPDVFEAARQRIGGQFTKLTKGTNVTLGQDFLNTLVDVEAQHAQQLPSLASSKVPKVIDDALALAAKGKISGEEYQSVRSAIAGAANDAFRANDSALGQSLKAIRAGLDDAADQSMTQTERAAWGEARRQWKALRILETGNVVENGNVSAALLKGQVKKSDPILYREGRLMGPLSDIARYAEGVKPLSDSGTAGNLMAMQAINSPLGFFQTLLGNPMRYAAAKTMLSQKGGDWLANGKMTPEARRLLMQGGGLLGIASGATPAAQ